MSQNLFSNYIVSWTLTSNTDGRVRIELIYDLVAVEDDISAFTFPLLDTRFGSLVGNSISAFRDEVDFTSGTLSVEEDTLIAVMRFSPAISQGTSDKIRFSLLATDVVCSKDGQIGISATWASLLDTPTNLVEYDFFIQSDADDLDITFSPNSENAIRNSRSESDGFFIPYSRGTLDFGTDVPTDVFFSWDLEEFPILFNVQECEVIEEFEFPTAFLVGTVIVIFVICAVCGLISEVQRRFMARNQPRNLPRLMLPNERTRDIVLTPDGGAPSVVTVNATYDDNTEVQDETFVVTSGNNRLTI